MNRFKLMHKLLLVFVISFLFDAGLNAVLLKNKFIEVEVDDNSGRYVLRTTGGDPKLNTDQDKNLLYEMPNYPGTSYSTIHIDRKNYIFGSNRGVFTARPYQKNGKIYAVWKAKDIQVTQIVSIVKGPTTGNLDTILIEYIVENVGSRDRYVGTRILLDTLLGENDGAPFSVPGVGAVTSDKKFAGADIPKFWYAYDKTVNPTVRSMGTIIMDGFTPPDVLVMSNWKKMYKSPWDLKLKPGAPFKYSMFSPTDSAISLYWKTRLLAAGQKFVAATMYGLYGVAENSTEYFSLIIGGPYEANVGDVFIVTADVENKSPLDTVIDAQAFFQLPPSGELLIPENEQPTKEIGKLAPAQIGKVKWNIRAEKAGEATYTIRVKGYVKLGGGKEEREILAERKIKIHAKAKKQTPSATGAPPQETLSPQAAAKRKVNEQMRSQDQLMRLYAPHLRLPKFEYELKDYDMAEVDKRIQNANRDIRKLNDDIQKLELKIGIAGDTY